MSNIVIVFHCFCEGANTVAWTARRISVQHPMIAAMAFDLPLNERATIRPVFLFRQRSHCRMKEADKRAIRSKARENASRANSQRRIPSRSINDL
jgi:hypothetical protein